MHLNAFDSKALPLACLEHALMAITD